MEDALDNQEDMQATEATDSSAVDDADEQAGLGACDADAGDDDASGAAEAQGADEPGASGSADAAADTGADGVDDSGASASAEAEIAATVEAILFATDSPLSPAKIALLAELPNRGLVKRAVAHLNERYDRVGCSFCIEPIAGGYQMLTRPQYHDVVSRLFKNKSDSKLSQAAMETLAIVAYRQPVLRADIEAVRGVASGEMLRGLMEKNLVKIVGRAEVLGRPMLYGTTRQFLEVFGLNGIDDLPNVESLRGGRDANANAKKAAPAAQDADEAGDQQPAPADSKPEAQAQPPQPEEPLID
jgi:segregation and condensation protein B